MNRVRPSALGADKLRAMRNIARELETLPVYEALFQTRADQAAVMGNTVERAKLIGAHLVSRGKMTAEVLEALAAPWAKQALAIEPGVNFRDGMKLTRINVGLSFLTNEGAVPLVAASDAFYGKILPFRGDREFASQLGRRMATMKSSPSPTRTRNYFRIRKITMILPSIWAI